MDFVKHSGKAPAPDYMKLVISQVCLGVLMDAEVYVPKASVMNKEVYAEFARKYDLLPMHLKVSPAFELGHKILNRSVLPEATTLKLNVELGKRRFMTNNMAEVMAMLGQAERYLIPLADAFTEMGWTMHGIATLTHSSQEELPKWLLKGCNENRVKLVINDTYVVPKRKLG